MTSNNLDIVSNKRLSIDENNIEVLKDDEKVVIVWRNVFAMILLHIISMIACVQGMKGYGQWQTIIWFWLIALFSSLGVLAGSHRLWSHKSYKAKLPLRIILAVLQTTALQNDIYEWSRDHRVHHKYSETDADPHNAKRGFFFAHMGWLLCRKHSEVKLKGKTIDLSDLWADPVVRFQRRFYIPLIIIFWGIIPTVIPIYLWGEKFIYSLFGNLFRYVITLHHAWSVNSLAHIYGYRPYDKTINPRENPIVIYAAMGEGYHNYHHTFPNDYSASEYGWETNFNPATAFIDFFSAIGWAYDRKVISSDTIRKRIDRTGDSNDQIYKINYFTDLVKGILTLMYPILVVFISRLILSK